MMSKQGFDGLFEGCENDWPPRRRAIVEAAILRSLKSIEQARTAIGRVNFDNRGKMLSPVSSIITLEMTNVIALPSVKRTIDELWAPFNEALNVYERASAERRGIFRHKGRVTEAEFAALKDTVTQMLNNITTWLEEIKP